jgi:hypothetical protein
MFIAMTYASSGMLGASCVIFSNSASTARRIASVGTPRSSGSSMGSTTTR